MTFDPTKPLERQKYKGVNHPVIALEPSPFDTECYLSRSGPAGNFVRHDQFGKNVSGNSDYDLETIPERKPLVVSYINQYPMGMGAPRISLEQALIAGYAKKNALAVIEVTFDPNDGSVKSEVVWKPS